MKRNLVLGLAAAICFAVTPAIAQSECKSKSEAKSSGCKSLVKVEGEKAGVAEASCSEKSKVTLAAKKSSGDCCKTPSKSSLLVKKTASSCEEKTSSCSKAPAVALASSEKKSSCCKDAAPTLAKTEKKASSCKSSGVTLATKEAKGSSCSSKTGATLATKESKSSSCSSKADVTLATKEAKGSSCSSKTGATLATKESKGSSCSSSTGVTLATKESKSSSCCPTATKKAVVSSGCGVQTMTAFDAAVNNAVKNLPTLSFKVGNNVVCCYKEAQAISEHDELPMLYVVKNKSFANYDEAQSAYIGAVNEYITRYASVKSPSGDNSSCCAGTKTAGSCSEEGAAVYEVAGRQFNCPDQAGSIAKMTQVAMKKVAMSYQVGDKTFECSTMARKAAGDKAVQFVVHGAKPTSCQVSATRDLATAKIKAAETALAQAGHLAKRDS